MATAATPTAGVGRYESGGGIGGQSRLGRRFAPPKPGIALSG
jgi:hypothetical protein